MKKIDLGQTIGILANLGVIAGIAFLAVELSQNNQLLEYEARQAQLNIRKDVNLFIAGNNQLAGVLAKMEARDDLTPAEQIQIDFFNNNVLSNWESMVVGYDSGLIAFEGVPVRVMRNLYCLNPYGIKDRWENYFAPGADPVFAEFMAKHITNSCAE